MFKMKVESQMNLPDRTLICGIPNVISIPPKVAIEGNKYNVIGISQGVRPPYISLEINKSTDNLVGFYATER